MQLFDKSPTPSTNVTLMAEVATLLKPMFEGADDGQINDCQASDCRASDEQITPSNLPTIYVKLVKTTQFLFVLFDTASPMATDSSTAIQAGIASHFATVNPLALERELRQDYLWEKTCFECFISGDSPIEDRANSPYLEINLAPQGAFNLYYFDSYRTPSQMPPRRLPVEALDYGKDINFFNQPMDSSLGFWQSASREMLDEVQWLAQAYPLASLHHRTAMVLRLEALTTILPIPKGELLVNPCWVYQSQADKPVLSYWASHHVSPPDFHDKSVWQNI
ncbi:MULTISPECIES: hypothetical protein [unclassified Moraxella]|uniref:hypothetical protein n=1 Tax=unclassified Moraxella TaxID=2685852 RepID=UPI003AF88551